MCHAALWPRNTRVGTDVRRQWAAQAGTGHPAGRVVKGACPRGHVSGTDQLGWIHLGIRGPGRTPWPLFPHATALSVSSLLPVRAAAVLICFAGASCLRLGVGFGLGKLSLFVSFQWSVLQIQTNFIKASGGAPPHDTCRKDAHSTRDRIPCMGRHRFADLKCSFLRMLLAAHPSAVAQ